MKKYFVYILANRRNGAIYVGVSGNLQKRVSIHKADIAEGFTKRYEVPILAGNGNDRLSSRAETKLD